VFCGQAKFYPQMRKVDNSGSGQRCKVGQKELYEKQVREMDWAEIVEPACTGFEISKNLYAPSREDLRESL
jgi:hypothetical protein